MMSKKSPQLRFKGFTDDWEERKLGDYAKYRRGSFPQPYGNKEWYDGEGAMPFVQVVDVTNKLTLVENTKQKISKLAQSKSVFVPKGKVVVTLQGSIGRVAITQYDSFVDRTLLIFEDYEKETDERFWAYTIQKKFEIEKLKAPGGTIKTITKEALSSFDVHLPKFEEQQKIGSFFKQLDETIALHQRKLDLLKEQKKGFLQKMFPKNGEKVPELRFAGFADDWEQRKLGEIANMHARIGWQNLRTSEFLDSGEYMLITGTDFQDGKIDYSKVHYVEKERYEQDKKIQISNGSILITKDGTIGKVAYVENLPMKSTLNAGVFNLTVVDDINTSNLYLYHYLKGPFLLRFVNEESTGGTIKHLNQNVLVKFPIPLPSYREQLKISAFLTNIDKLITLHQRKLDLLKEQKKGFLQKMFV